MNEQTIVRIQISTLTHNIKTNNNSCAMTDTVLKIILQHCKQTIRSVIESIRMGDPRTLWQVSLLGVFGSIVLKTLGVPIVMSVPSIIVLVLVYLTRFYKWLHIALVTAPRDLRGLISLIRLRWLTNSSLRNDLTIPKHFRKLVRKHPDKVCFVDEERAWTYREVDEYSNRLANAFLDAGYKCGDVVALFKESCPEFVCIWLGLAKIGVVTALVNFNLRQQPLVHSITSANGKTVIFGSELSDAVNEIKESLPEDTIFYCHGTSEKVSFAVRSIDACIRSASTGDPPRVDVKLTDRAILIYTSGTTGLPKAAVITHLRYIFMAGGVRYFFKIVDNDVLYDPLPLYHSAGGVLGVGQALIFGNTIAIRRKFSASKFWDDCIRFECTVSQYIGEICRYLLSQPEKPQDKLHSVRMMFGNGLRPQNWQAFLDRFGLKQMCELYGATEGNANILNTENRIGAIGFVSRIAPFAYPCTLIKVDESGEVQRDSEGMCIKCKPGEPGEFVGKIARNNPVRAFDGYVSKSATEKKIVTDVFSRGDECFLSGDILVMDEYGFLYFVDRRGDTFRWKGENVSTAEVEGVISNVALLKDCVVYGVEVPGSEGRAGMAAILDEDHSLNLDDLAAGLQKCLPMYARPIFVRILDSIPMTGTFKLKKVDLQKDGFDPALCSQNGNLYYLNGYKYSLLDADTYEGICSGMVRV